MAKTRSNDLLDKPWDPKAYSASLLEQGLRCLTECGRLLHLGPHCHGEWVAGAAPATLPSTAAAVSPGGGRCREAGGRAAPSQPFPARPRRLLTLLQGDEHAARRPALLEEPGQLRQELQHNTPR